jgi:hypothetical protein
MLSTGVIFEGDEKTFSPTEKEISRALAAKMIDVAAKITGNRATKNSCLLCFIDILLGPPEHFYCHCQPN